MGQPKEFDTVPQNTLNSSKLISDLTTQIDEFDLSKSSSDDDEIVTEADQFILSIFADYEDLTEPKTSDLEDVEAEETDEIRITSGIQSSTSMTVVEDEKNKSWSGDQNTIVKTPQEVVEKADTIASNSESQT